MKGIKVDFMQREDQWMVNFYERTAKEAAKRKMLVDFHGAYKPTGLYRTWPNLINNEGVLGLEQSKWGLDAGPENAVTFPFLRMMAGPVDYTPGAMLNGSKDAFQPIFNRPMSQGTRCQQLGDVRRLRGALADARRFALELSPRAGEPGVPVRGADGLGRDEGAEREGRASTSSSPAAPARTGTSVR